MFVSMGPFVPSGSPAGGHSRAVGGFYSWLPGFIFRACLAALVGLLLAISPVGGGWGAVSLLSFSSLL